MSYKILNMPYYWRDQLKDILLEQGFDAVLKQIELYFKDNDFLVVDDRFPHTKGARKGPQIAGLYGINIDQSLHLLVMVLVVYLIGRG